MEKEDFITKMDDAISAMGSTYCSDYSCIVVNTVFYMYPEVKARYSKSIKHLFRTGEVVDWIRLGGENMDLTRKREYRINWLKAFKAKSLEDNFYGGL